VEALDAQQKIQKNNFEEFKLNFETILNSKISDEKKKRMRDHASSSL
jgi:hypothetical protein